MTKGTGKAVPPDDHEEEEPRCNDDAKGTGKCIGQDPENAKAKGKDNDADEARNLRNPDKLCLCLNSSVFFLILIGLSIEKPISTQVERRTAYVSTRVKVSLLRDTVAKTMSRRKTFRQVIFGDIMRISKTLLIENHFVLSRKMLQGPLDSCLTLLVHTLAIPGSV